MLGYLFLGYQLFSRFFKSKEKVRLQEEIISKDDHTTNFFSSSLLKEDDLFLQFCDYCMRCAGHYVHRKLPIKTFTAWIVDFSVLFRYNLHKLFHLKIET